MAVDPNGYCTQCGTFRGQVAQPVSGAPYPPQGYQPYPPVQPASGTPYSAPPTSAAPYPFSGPPVSGAPGYSAPPAPPARNRFILPLIASVAVLVVLIGAIVVLAIVRSGKAGPGPTGSPIASGSTAPSAVIDPCLVGTWQASSERQQMDFPGVGAITMIGHGQVTHVYPDGRVDDDYGQATPYTGSYSGHTITMTVTGTVHSRIVTSNGTLSYHDAKPNGSVVFNLDGAQTGSAIPLSVITDPVQYTCLNNTANLHTSQYEVTMTKISPNP
jgi:hypothetical protein